MKRVVLLLALAGCHSEPKAKELCARLEGKGLGTCEKRTPNGFASAAEHVFRLELRDRKGEGCFLMSFDSDARYEATAKRYERIADDIGPHHYGNPKRRIFAQCGDLSDADATTVRAEVAAF